MRPVTTPAAPVRPDRTRVLTEVLGLLLVLAGLGALLTAAFLVDLRLGLAVSGALGVSAGAALVTDRQE